MACLILGESGHINILVFGNFRFDPGNILLLQFSAGIIPLCNIAIGIEVAAALFAIFITLVILRVGEKL